MSGHGNGRMRYSLLAIFLLTAGCGALPLGMLGGGGPNVAANVQAGKENTQQLVANQERTEAGRDIITETKQVEAAQVESPVSILRRLTGKLIASKIALTLAPLF